jgi:hypothetical protein
VPNEIRSLYDFQVPQQGHQETLHRLGKPGEITAHFRSKGLTFTFEAIAFLIVIGMGVLWMRKSATYKVAFLVFAGVLGMLDFGILSPANSLIAIAWVRAVCCVAALWIGMGLLPLFGVILAKLKQAPKPPKPPAPPPRIPVQLNPAPAPAPQPAPAPAPPPITPQPAPAKPSDDDVMELPEVKDEGKDGK